MPRGLHAGLCNAFLVYNNYNFMLLLGRIAALAGDSYQLVLKFGTCHAIWYQLFLVPESGTGYWYVCHGHYAQRRGRSVVLWVTFVCPEKRLNRSRCHLRPELTRVSPGSHVLDVSPDPQREGGKNWGLSVPLKSICIFSGMPKKRLNR